MHLMLSIHEIKAQFPNQWVLIGDPQVSEPGVLGSLVDKLISGVVLFASANKQDIALHAASKKAGYSRTACIYTGEISRHRNWLL